MTQIEQRQLKGLVFRSSERKPVVEDGRKKFIHERVERPLTPDDILSATDYDTFTRIVTKDGKKYDIPLAGKGGGAIKEKGE